MGFVPWGEEHVRTYTVKILVLGLVAVVTAVLAAPHAMACYFPNPEFVVDPNNLMVTFSGLTFAAADPNQNTCACGLSLPAGATATAVEVLDLDENPIMEFEDFGPDPNDFDTNATAEFQSLQVATPGTAWWAFKSMVAPGNIPAGPALLRFHVNAPGMTAQELKVGLELGGFVGAAQADLNGENFDPGHTAIVQLGNQIPALSEWGMIALAAVILLTGITMVARRRRPARTV